MKANPLKGEISCQIQGQDYLFALTLNSLAILEDQLGESFINIFERITKGQYQAKDILSILETSLKSPAYHADVFNTIEPKTAINIVALLIKQSFLSAPFEENEHLDLIKKK